MTVPVPFQQLLSAVKALPPAQKAQLRKELDSETPSPTDKNSFIHFLLNGPVYSEQEIAVIDENRKSISAWRTKA